MLFNNLRRCLSFVLVLLMALSLMTVSALAEGDIAEESEVATEPKAPEALREAQIAINDILTRYLGGTEISVTEMESIVAEMDWETYQTARWEISKLDNAVRDMLATGEISKEDVQSLLDSNQLFCNFATSLENRHAGDFSVSTYATSLSLFDGALTITDNNGSGSNSNGTITISVQASLFSSKTNTITFTNTTSVNKILSFSYSLSGQDSHSFEKNSGNIEKVLAANSSCQWTVTTDIWTTKATLTITNLTFEDAAASSSITVSFDSSLGSVTVAGTPAASGIPVSGVSNTTEVALVATPNSGVSFLGWLRENGEVLSTSTTYTSTFGSDTVLKAAFATNSGTGKAYFGVGSISEVNNWGTVTYSIPAYPAVFDNLTDAISYATSTTSKGIVLLNSGILPALTDNPSTTDVDESIYTIPAGVTLLIPYDSANTLCTTAPTYNGAESNPMPAPTIFRTLTMAEGAKITVNGAISLSAQMVGYQPTRSNGAPYGELSHIVMNSGSSITVNSGGNLYCWGIISEPGSGSGSGSVTMNPGSSVYQNFQITDFRGGQASLSMEGNSNEVFPLSQYYVQNVEVPLTIHSGAKVTVNSAMLMSLVGMQKPAVTFVGDDSGGLFQITSGSVTMDYQENADRMKFTVNGDVSIDSVTLSFKYLGSTIDLNTADYVLPLNPNISILIESGSNVDISQDIAVLPGTEVIIEEDATAALSNSANMFIYDLDQWGPYVMDAVKMRPVRWSYANGSTAMRTEASLADASVCINGTLDATNGSIYTTSSGANIHSTGSGVIMTTAGTKTLTYQATYANETISYSDIGITPAKLLNSNSTYTETTGASSTTYKYINGFWHSGGACTGGTATCSKKAVCTICGQEYGALANHTEVVDAAVAATCTTPGKTEGKHCSVCNAVIVPQEDIPTLSHSYTSVVTKPTCTTAGYTTHTCIACGDSYTDTEVPANGHNWGDWSTYKCNVCNCAAIQFSTIQLSIESEIQLLLKFTVHQDLLSNFPDLTAYVTEEKNRIEPEDSWNKKVTELPIDNGRYVISQGIAAGEMTGIVAVQFKNGETVIPAFDPVKNEMVNTVERSVISFAEAALEAEGEDGRNVALCKGALTFGGYAQQFFETHTDKLAYSFFGETAPDVAVSSWEGFTTTVTSTEGFTLIPTTQKINLDSKIDIRLYFEGEVGGCTVTVTRPINKGTDTETIALSFGNENGRTYLDIEDVPPAYWNDSYLITVTNGQSSYTVTTSVLAWCARCVQSPAASVEQQKMAQAMYHYSRAADAYFTEQNAQ